jgi:hypothetical protein
MESNRHIAHRPDSCRLANRNWINRNSSARNDIGQISSSTSAVADEISTFNNNAVTAGLTASSAISPIVYLNLASTFSLMSASPTLLPMTKTNKTSKQTKMTNFFLGQKQQQAPAPQTDGLLNSVQCVTSKTQTNTYDAECHRNRQEQQLLANERQRITGENECLRPKLGFVSSPLSHDIWPAHESIHLPVS